MGKPISFLNVPGQRGTGILDSRCVNVLFEIQVNPVTEEQKVYVVKRPGLANNTQPPGGAAAGRGMYLWTKAAGSQLYSVFANKVYSGTTDLGVTLAGSTGRVWWTEIPVSSGAHQLVLSDGADNYNITTADAITQIDTTDDAQYPASNLGPVVFLDGYLFQALSNGQIWQSDLNSLVSWTAGNFLSVDTHGGFLEAIHIQKNQILAFTKTRIEFFFNNGNPSGSVLLRIDQNTLGIGLAAKETLAFHGETCIFVGVKANDGGGTRAIFQISSLSKVNEISNPVINRLLNAEGSSISTASAWMEVVAGQLVYVINLDSAERTLVYSVDTRLWCEWADTSGDVKFPGIAATSTAGATVVQDVANGRIYTFPATTFQDSGTDFPVRITTNRSNHGSQERKFEQSLSVIGDTTTGSLTVSTSDDDFTTFNTARNIDMSQPVKRLYRLGSFYERAHRFTYTNNAALRLQAFVPELTNGKH